MKVFNKNLIIIFAFTVQMFAILILNQWMVAFGTVIGNILDNAIEAMLEKPDDRLDGLSLKNGKGFLMNIFK